MADKKISQLNSASPISGSEELPVVQSGTTFKTTINAIKTFFDSIYTTTSAVASQITSALSGYVNTSGLTTNYLPKASDSDTLANSQIFDDGTNVGIGTTSPTAKVDVRGQTISGNGSGNASSNDSPFYASRPNTGAPNYHSGWQYVFEAGGGIWGIGMKYSTNEFQFLTNGGSTAKFVFGSGNPTSPASRFTMDLSGGFFGANVVPDANIHAKGIDSTSSNFAAKFDNSSNQQILHLRNDRVALFYGVVNLDNLTASQIVETDSNKNLISAAKGTAYNLNLGTTAGTVLEGNRITQTITNGVTDRAPSEDAVFDALAAKLDTVILQTASSGFNPADATTYYMGISGIAPNTTATNFAFKIGYNFRLIGAVITSVTAGTSGTAENNTINFRNITTATSSLISNSVKTNATTTASINQTVTGLNITGTSTDDVCIEWVTPTWATNPTTCAIILRLYVEKLS